MRGRSHGWGVASGRVGAALVAVVLVLAGCGSDGDSPDEGGSVSASGSPAATGAVSSSQGATPSEDATPSVLEGGQRVQGPGFAFMVAPGYEKVADSFPGMEKGEWYRQYSGGAPTAFEVTYNDGPRRVFAQSMDFYLTSRGAERIRHQENVEVMSQKAYHWRGQNEHVVFNVYLVAVDRGNTVIISSARPRGDQRDRRLQRAMLESFHLVD